MPTLHSPSRSCGLAAKYGLEPVPENLLRLTRLVAQPDTDLDQVGRLISQDKAITARLLRLANPRSTSEEDYHITTVEDALMRTGLAPVILLSMVTPLGQAVVSAFEMFLTPVSAVALESLQPVTGAHVLATVQFAGKGTGLVQLRLSTQDAARIAQAALMGSAQPSDAEIDDVIGELANMIGGNLESKLSDGGLTCRLATPEVSRAADFQKENIAGVACERLGFFGSGITAFVDASVNPWSD